MNNGKKQTYKRLNQDTVVLLKILSHRCLDLKSDTRRNWAPQFHTLRSAAEPLHCTLTPQQHLCLHFSCSRYTSPDQNNGTWSKICRFLWTDLTLEDWRWGTDEHCVAISYSHSHCGINSLQLKSQNFISENHRALFRCSLCLNCLNGSVFN